MDLEKYVFAPVGAKFKIENRLENVFRPGMYATLYCPKCEGVRNFRFSDDDQTHYGSFGATSSRRHQYVFRCDCGTKFEMTFTQFEEKQITKVGQYPGSILFDPGVNNGAVQTMTEQQKEDYLDAIKSHSEGLGVGAFEYLRRAFVCMISEAKKRFLEENPKENDGKGNIKGVRNETRDVIKKLVEEDKLDPIFLEPGFTIVYPLLSDGIHNKSNEECAEYYEILKEGIELIAQRNYALQERQKRVAAMSKALGKIPSEQERAKKSHTNNHVH